MAYDKKMLEEDIIANLSKYDNEITVTFEEKKYNN